MILLQTITEPVPASGAYLYLWLMIAIPAVSAAILLIGGRLTDAWGHLLGTAASVASFGVALAAFLGLLASPDAARRVSLPLYPWFSAGSWDVGVGLLVDQLSILFALLITGVGSLIHVYSIGYMAADPRRRRFFALLNLFVAAMLLLVLADDYLVLFVGWEGVGLASYLLISFWQHKPSAASAGVKAFVMNRVGDLGMLMAIATMLALFGGSSFATVAEGVTVFRDEAWLTALGLFLLLAACGKSAQVPLHAWLLDAMEGPTPVSALIHAATMVTAGVYVVVRSHVIFEAAPVAATAVVVVGTVTLLAGAWIGTAQDDIKKVLAGSTMSQIGYMMLAAGVGPAGYAFAIFHLLTHGFFKANMFLGAGSVMHGMDDDVNMRHYGALNRAMRVTFLTFAMGYLAIIGFPLFSGYFSKDHIIEAAFGHNVIVGVCALVGAGLTAYYMTRLMWMTFFGDRVRGEGAHPHESPAVMTVPLLVLAVFSVGIGVVMNDWIQGWLEPALGVHPHEVSLVPTAVGLATMAVVAAGVVLSWLVFGRRPVPLTAPATRDPLTIAGRNALYGDRVNDVVVVRPTYATASALEVTDRRGIDAAVDGTARAFGGLSTQVRRLQSGYVRGYALTMLFGVLIVGVVLILALVG